jgi:tripartite-type tricarboxylate transporter receptor subunit TctC
MPMMQALTRRRTLMTSLTLSATFTLAVRGAFAQAYPDRPVRLLVGGAAGSVPDTLARVVADRLSLVLKQPVVVDNRPGAAGSIAIGALLAGKPDGYTLALATMSQAVFNSYLFSNLPYDPIRDLTPIAPLASGAMAIAAHPTFAARTFAEFVSTAKAQPDKVLVGTAGIGSPPHVFANLLIRATGIKVTLVPYKSGAEGMTGVMRGDVQLFVDAPTIISPQARIGTVKVLAVTGRSREAELPEVPTIAETGFPNAEAEAWIGLVAAAHTPLEIVTRLNHALVEILTTADFRQKLKTLSFVAVTSSPEEFGRRIRDDHVRWGPIIKDAGITLD